MLTIHLYLTLHDLGRNKLIVNHLGKLFVTSDAATIIREIEVVHPAAKLLVMASEAQESEVRSIITLQKSEPTKHAFRWVTGQILSLYLPGNC